MIGTEICKMAANGNTEAEAFCLSWLDLVHLVDDCHDRDVPVDDNRLSATLVPFILTLSGNSFFLANKAMLVSLMVMSFNAWCDSNWLYHVKRKSEASVLKGFYHEVIYYVAFLCGGWQHLRSMTGERREYNFDAGIRKELAIA